MNRWLQRARLEGNPVMDRGGAVIVWHGAIAPGLIGDFNGWDVDHALRGGRAGPRVWTYRLDLPPDAYMEYAFVRRGRRTPDPLNPQRVVWNGVGEYNHYFYMPEAGLTPLARRARGLPRGRVTRHVVDLPWLAARRRRAIHLYQPALPGPAPLLVVYDGADYLRRARLTALLDNLIADGRVRPLAAAFVPHGGPARPLEYACSEATLVTLLQTVLPLARAELNLVDPDAQPGAFGVLGASMGGLMALYTGLRLPRLFGHVLSQSGAYSLAGMDFVVWDLLRAGPSAPLHLWLDVGQYDHAEILLANRRLRELLQERGSRFAYREFNAGHNYTAWRDEVWRGLEYLFPPG